MLVEACQLELQMLAIEQQNRGVLFSIRKKQEKAELDMKEALDKVKSLTDELLKETISQHTLAVKAVRELQSEQDFGTTTCQRRPDLYHYIV